MKPLLSSPIIVQLQTTSEPYSSQAFTLLLPTLALVAMCIFLLLFFEFSLVRATSSLTLSVFGVVKEMLTIGIASIALGEAISVLNIVGFAICAGGVLLYHGVVFLSDKAEAEAAMEEEEERDVSLSRRVSEALSNHEDDYYGDASGGAAAGQGGHDARAARAGLVVEGSLLSTSSVDDLGPLPPPQLQRSVSSSSSTSQHLQHPPRSPSSHHHIRALGLSMEAGSPPTSPKSFIRQRLGGHSRSTSRSGYSSRSSNSPVNSVPPSPLAVRWQGERPSHTPPSLVRKVHSSPLLPRQPAAESSGDKPELL